MEDDVCGINLHTQVSLYKLAERIIIQVDVYITLIEEQYHCNDLQLKIYKQACKYLKK